MTLLLTLTFIALIAGSGSMLMEPAERKPNTALGGVLVFALFIDLAAISTAIFGFNVPSLTLLIVILVAAVVVLGFGARRRLALPGWPIFAVLGVVLLLYLAPVVVLPVPLDTDAQGFGYLALMVREGRTISTLAPFHPEISYLYSPAFLVLAAYTSAISGVGLHAVQMALGAGLGFLFVWLAYDLGQELGKGPIMLAMAVLGTGVFTAYMDSHYTTLMALDFGLAFVTFVVRYLDKEKVQDALGAAVCLAAVPLTHPDTTIILMIGYVPWLATIWLARPKPNRRAWLSLAAGIPAGALLVVLPWLIHLAPLLGSEIASPFTVELRHLLVMVGMSGVLVPVLAVFGVMVAGRRRSPVDLWMLTWLAAVVEFGALGILGRLLPFLENTVLKYDYPFSIAWHGPIIPFLYLSTVAAGWMGRSRVVNWVQRRGKLLLTGGAVLIVLAVIFSPQIVLLSKGRVNFFGAFSSHADVAAMQWLKKNAPPGARILNYGTDHEAEWTAVIAERDAVFYRPQPFFRGAAGSLAEQDRLREFWADPADPRWADVLAAYDIDYVLVPQIIGNPAAQAELFRWRAPYVIEAASTPADASYLNLVYEKNGAAIYALDAP